MNIVELKRALAREQAEYHARADWEDSVDGITAPTMLPDIRASIQELERLIARFPKSPQLDI